MTKAIYQNLNIRAYARLADLRGRAQQFNERAYTSKTATWRDVRHAKFSSASDAGVGANDGTPVWYAFSEQFPREMYADEVGGVRIAHTGWFCDPDQFERARGLVVSLPHGRYLAGYAMDDSGQRVYFFDLHDDIKDAARMADEHARVIAEQEYDYQEKRAAAQNLESSIDENLQRLRECIALRHQTCMNYVRNEARELCESIRTARETLRTDFAGVL